MPGEAEMEKEERAFHSHCEGVFPDQFQSIMEDIREKNGVFRIITVALPGMASDCVSYLGYMVNDQYYFGSVYSLDSSNVRLYTGYYDENGEFDGLGCSYQVLMFCFIGFFSHGRPMRGQMIVNRSLIYEGEVNSQYEMEGRGILFYQDYQSNPMCIQVEGHFKSNKVNGFAKMYYPIPSDKLAAMTGSHNCGSLRYVGNIEDNLYEGKGVFCFEDKSFVYGYSASSGLSIPQIMDTIRLYSEDEFINDPFIEDCWKESLPSGEMTVTTPSGFFTAIFNAEGRIAGVRQLVMEDGEYSEVVIPVEEDEDGIAVGFLHFRMPTNDDGEALSLQVFHLSEQSDQHADQQLSQQADQPPQQPPQSSPQQSPQLSPQPSQPSQQQSPQQPPQLSQQQSLQPSQQLSQLSLQQPVNQSLVDNTFNKAALLELLQQQLKVPPTHVEWNLLRFSRQSYARPTRSRDSKVIHKDKTVSFFLDETLRTLVSWGRCTVINNHLVLNGPQCRVYNNGRLAIEGFFKNDKLVDGTLFYENGRIESRGLFTTISNRITLKSGIQCEDTDDNLVVASGSFTEVDSKSVLNGENCRLYMQNGIIYEGSFLKGQLKKGRILTPIPVTDDVVSRCFDYDVTEGYFIQNLANPNQVMPEYDKLFACFYYNSVTKQKQYQSISMQTNGIMKDSLFVIDGGWIVKAEFNNKNQFQGRCTFYQIPQDEETLAMVFDVFSDLSLDNRCQLLPIAWRGNYVDGKLEHIDRCVTENNCTVSLDVHSSTGEVTRQNMEASALIYEGEIGCNFYQGDYAIASFVYRILNEGNPMHIVLHVPRCANPLVSNTPVVSTSSHESQSRRSIRYDRITVSGWLNDQDERWHDAIVTVLHEEDLPPQLVYRGDLLKKSDRVSCAFGSSPIVPDGNGRLFNGSLLMYEGGFKDGYRSGEGRSYLGREKEYEGEWKNDRFDGKGTYFWKGLLFRGVFSEGKMKKTVQVSFMENEREVIVFRGRIGADWRPKHGVFFVSVCDSVGKVTIRMSDFSSERTYTVQDDQKRVIYKGCLSFKEEQYRMVPKGKGVLYDQRRLLYVTGVFDMDHVDHCCVYDHERTDITSDMTVSAFNNSWCSL